MQPPPMPATEPERLRALRSYGVLDTPPESSFDDVTALAAHICEAPVSLVTLIDEDRQWFKSRFGWGVEESSRAVSFCAHAICSPDLLVVEDAREDPRFSENPDVLGPPGIRFYAGALLTNPEGYALGTLCVIDYEPRELEPHQERALRVLARHVMTLMELRRRTRERDLSNSVINSLPGVFYVFDRDGRFLRWNDRLEEVTGYPADELAALHPLEFFRGEDRDRIATHIERAFEEGATEVEASLVARDGTAIPYFFTGHRGELGGEPCLIGMGVDVSRRRRAEAVHAALVESARDAIVTLEPDGTLATANRAFEEMTGMPPSASEGRVLSSLLPEPDDRAFVAEAVAKTAAGEAVPVFEIHLPSSNGDVVPVEVTWTRFEATAGEERILMIARDVRIRRALDERLRQVQGLDAVGRLAAGVAHDFNNLLQVVVGEADLILEVGEVPPDLAEGIGQIREAAGRGTRLARELLTLSRKQEMQARAVDVGETVLDFAPMMRRLLGEKVELAIEIDPGLPTVEGDPSKIEQVLMNLVINAGDAMPEGGTLDIGVESLAVDAEMANRYPDAAPGSYVRITVEDSGTGITPDDLAHIFEPLFTTKDEGHGTGLGLATVYGIVRRHRGWIAVDSEVGRGTSVRVHLPVAGSA